MNHFNGGCHEENRCPIGLVRSEGRNAQARPDALAAAQCAVAHRFMNLAGNCSFRRKEAFKSRFNLRTHAIKKRAQITAHFPTRMAQPEAHPGCSSRGSRLAVPPAPTEYGKNAIT